MIGDLENDAAKPNDTGEEDTGDTEGLLRTAKLWFREDREHSSDWRRDAKEDFDFASLRQWSDEDKRVLRDQMRPEITFDKVGTTVKTIVGIEIGNRREVRYFPRSEGDAKPDEVLTAAAQWARDASDAEDEETDAFKDCVICGMGWLDTRMEYETDPQGMILQERLDPMEMFWDGSARKPNLADARRLWRVRTMPIEDARLLAPDAEDSDLDATWASDDRETKEPHNADPHVAYQQDVDEELEKADGEEVTIVQLQYWERETYYRVAIGGQITSVPEADWPKLKKRIDIAVANGMLPPVQAVKQVRKVYKQALIGSKVLSMGPAACEGHFTWECITGERDQNSGTWYGVVRGMKDPQRWANKWLSQSLHILNTNAKGGLFAERGAFDNDVDAEQSYARSDRITWLKTGALAGNRIQQKVPPQLPQNLADLMAYALSSIRDASGVNLELAGLQEQDQSGILAEHRKQSGMTILASLFDSLRRYRKRQGRVMLYFIQNYISDGRLIRIVGEEGAKYVPLIHQEGVVEYDVVVDDDPTSTNQKEKVWTTLMQMMPFLGDKLEASDLAILFEYSPLPQTVVETWQKKITSDEAQKAPIQQQMMQLQMEVAQTKAELQKAQADQASANAQKLLADAQTEMAAIGQPDVETETKLRAAMAEEALRRDTMLAKHNADMQATAVKHAASMQALELDNQLKTARANQEMAHAEREILMKEGKNTGDVVKKLADATSEAVDRLAKSHAEHAQRHADQLHHIAKLVSSPKRIVRDPRTGKVLGVETVSG